MKIDLKGLICPQPVINTKQNYEILKNGENLEIIVDNETAKQNIERFLNSQNQSFQTKQNNENEWEIHLTKEKNDKTIEISEKNEKMQEVLLLKSLKVGDGELGQMLFCGFLNALKERKIDTIVLINESVKVACDENHNAFGSLKELEKIGVKILCCANCLNYYQISPKVGVISNAYEIIDTLFNAKVVSL